MFQLETAVLAVDSCGSLIGGEDAASCAYYAKWIRSGRHLSGKFISRAQRLVARNFDTLVRLAVAATDVPTAPTERIVQVRRVEREDEDSPEWNNPGSSPEATAMTKAGMPDWYC